MVELAQKIKIFKIKKLSLFCGVGILLTIILAQNVIAQTIMTKQYFFDKIIFNENGNCFYNSTNNTFTISPMIEKGNITSISLKEGILSTNNISAIKNEDNEFLNIEAEHFLSLKNETYNCYDNSLIPANEFSKNAEKSENYIHFVNNTINVPIVNNQTIPANFTNDLEIFSFRAISYSPRYRNCTSTSPSYLDIIGDLSLSGYSASPKSTLMNISINSLTNTPKIIFNLGYPGNLIESKCYIVFNFTNNIQNKQLSVMIGNTYALTTEFSQLFCVPLDSISNQVEISFLDPLWTIGDFISIDSCFILYPEKFINNIRVDHLKYLQNNEQITINSTNSLYMQLDLGKSFINWSSLQNITFNFYYKLMKSQLPLYNSSERLSLSQQNISCYVDYTTPISYPLNDLKFEIYGITYDYLKNNRFYLEINFNISLIFKIKYSFLLNIPGVCFEFTDNQTSFLTTYSELLINENPQINETLIFNNINFHKLIISYSDFNDYELFSYNNSKIALNFIDFYAYKSEYHTISLGNNMLSNQKVKLSFSYQSPISFKINLLGINYLLNPGNNLSKIYEITLQPEDRLNITILNQEYSSISLYNLKLEYNTTINDSTSTESETSTNSPDNKSTTDNTTNSINTNFKIGIKNASLILIISGIMVFLQIKIERKKKIK